MVWPKLKVLYVVTKIKSLICCDQNKKHYMVWSKLKALYGVTKIKSIICCDQIKKHYMVWPNKKHYMVWPNKKHYMVWPKLKALYGVVGGVTLPLRRRPSLAFFSFFLYTNRTSFVISCWCILSLVTLSVISLLITLPCQPFSLHNFINNVTAVPTFLTLLCIAPYYT